MLFLSLMLGLALGLRLIRVNIRVDLIGANPNRNPDTIFADPHICRPDFHHSL